MFGTFFCSYLEKKGVISSEERKNIIEKLRRSRLKLGFLAIAEKMLTISQANEINALQAQVDKRFGDIAIEKGYLTKSQLERILLLQGNAYLHFLQAVTELDIMTEAKVEDMLLELKKDYGFSDKDMNDFRSGDTEKLISLFASTGIPYYDSYISLAIRNIVRFIDTQVYVSGVKCTRKYAAEHIAMQEVEGQHSIFLGFASQADELIELAGPYAKEEFTEVNEDVYDAVGEFVNCINGLFASNLSINNVIVDMLPPASYDKKRLEAMKDFYVVSIVIREKTIDMIIAIDSDLHLK